MDNCDCWLDKWRVPAKDLNPLMLCRAVKRVIWELGTAHDLYFILSGPFLQVCLSGPHQQPPSVTWRRRRLYADGRRWGHIRGDQSAIQAGNGTKLLWTKQLHSGIENSEADVFSKQCSPRAFIRWLVCQRHSVSFRHPVRFLTFIKKNYFFVSLLGKATATSTIWFLRNYMF